MPRNHMSVIMVGISTQFSIFGNVVKEYILTMTDVCIEI